jgi:hypothetical protein
VINGNKQQPNIWRRTLNLKQAGSHILLCQRSAQQFLCTRASSKATQMMMTLYIRRRYKPLLLGFKISPVRSTLESSVPGLLSDSKVMLTSQTVHSCQAGKTLECAVPEEDPRYPPLSSVLKTSGVFAAVCHCWSSITVSV